MLATLLLLLAAPQLEAQWPKPGAVEADLHLAPSEHNAQAKRGGEVAVAVPALPPSLNAMIESSGVARGVLYETHESLLRRDWETWQLAPALAKSMRARRDGAKRIFEFELRDDVRWHDGHPFDAGDVVFSLECFRNPHVRCDRKRGAFEKIEHVERTGPHSLRVVFSEPYAFAETAFDETLTILPAHVYDLSDADNPARAEEFTAEEQARVVNTHAANREWVGLGPYRVVRFDSERIVAERWSGYFDAAQGGWLERITWRALGDPNSALAALLEGEVDFVDRLSVEDYLGERTSGEDFAARFAKGLILTPSLSLVAWNLERPELADARVRNALALACDWDAILAGVYGGLASRVTGEQPAFAPHYDRSIAPLPHDRSRATQLLAQAGWIDRDGDGLVDKDGRTLELDYLHSAGAAVTERIAQSLQSDLAEVGVRLHLAPRDSAAFSQALSKREFDAAALTIASSFETDPESMWHSRWASGAGANRWGLRDETVDRLIGQIQTEPDAGKRATLRRALQARIYELQPCMFGLWAARRFAIDRRLRGVQWFGLDPGYSLRRWQRVGE